MSETNQRQGYVSEFSKSVDSQEDLIRIDVPHLQDGREDIVKTDGALEQGGQLGVLGGIAALGPRPEPCHGGNGGGGQGRHPVLGRAGDLGQPAWTLGQPARRLAWVTRHL